MLRFKLKVTLFVAVFTKNSLKMKKALLIVMMVFTCIMYLQKKTNGTIYVDHLAINVIESMIKAFVGGDADKVTSFFS